jgi:hypothetical protein
VRHAIAILLKWVTEYAPHVAIMEKQAQSVCTRAVGAMRHLTICKCVQPMRVPHAHIHASALSFAWESQFCRDVDLFVRFSNSVLNDMIYLIDESLIKASALHLAQAEVRSAPYASRRELLERSATLARGLRTASVLAIHTVQLLTLMGSHPNSRAIIMR